MVVSSMQFFSSYMAGLIYDSPARVLALMLAAPVESIFH